MKNTNINDAIQILENAYQRYLSILIIETSKNKFSKENDKYLVYCYQLDCVIKNLKRCFKEEL